MKIHSVIFCISLLLVSCNNGMNENPILIQPTLSSCIEEAFTFFIKYEKHPDTTGYYSISFHKDIEELGVWDDTLILIGKPNGFFPKDGFKGYATIGDFKILVFDKQNLGGSFYNQDSLKSIDLDNIRFTDSAFFLDVIVADSVLQPRGCGIDGYESFKIKS